MGADAPAGRSSKEWSGSHAEDEDALRCQEAVQGDGFGQAHAPQGGQDAPERAQAEHPYSSARRRQGSLERRRGQGPQAAGPVERPHPPPLTSRSNSHGSRQALGQCPQEAS